MRKYLVLIFKGFCMGIADIIPGVSGGTIAFLMGIYEELIESLHSFNLSFVRKILKGKFHEAFAATGWKFLLVLLCGILTAIFSLSHVLRWLLERYPVAVHAFFFGLILATVVMIARKVRKGDFGKVSVALISAVAMYRLVGMVPITTPETWWFLIFSGAVAICAMILPGISGAFILLLLGKYEYLITAVSERNLAVLALVALGCAVGLLSFVRFLRWVLHRYHDLALSVLAGFVLGSLRKIWPWKVTAQSILTPHGKSVPVEQANVFPQALSPEVCAAVVLCLLGICVGLLLSRCDGKQDLCLSPDDRQK